MKEEVVQIIAESLGVTPERITDGLAVYDIPEWGSIAQMQIITTLEDRYRFKFPVTELYKLTSVKAITDAVCALTKRD